MKEILDNATKLAKKLKSNSISTEHLTAEIIKANPRLANYLKISYDDIVKEIKNIYKTSSHNLIGNNQNLRLSPVLERIIMDYPQASSDLDYVDVLCEIMESGGIGSILMGNLGITYEKLEDYCNYGSTQLPKELINNDYIINLNKKIEDNNIHIYNMDDEIDNLINNLYRVRKPNVLLVGKAGCGKTALVEGLAERINRGKVPEWMKDKVILELILSNSVAGTKYRGEFEDRIKDILKAVTKCKRVILFIDEIHNIIGAGGAEGAIAAGDIFKPYLARGEISLIGATTTEEVKLIEKDKALQRRFTRIEMSPINDEKLYGILKGWSAQFENHYHATIDDELIRNVIRKCKKNKLMTSPDRELDELEKWCLDNCNWRAVEWELQKETVNN